MHYALRTTAASAVLAWLWVTSMETMQSNAENSGTLQLPTAGATAELKSQQGQSIGRARLTETPNGVTLTSKDSPLLDGDGAALVMHAKPDDYRTDPAGNAAERIACGIIQQQ